MTMNPHWRNGTPNAVKIEMSSTGRLIDSAVRKDTVIVPAGGYVVIAFVGDNPGYWFLHSVHCHIEMHQLEGMAVIIQEYIAKLNTITIFQWISINQESSIGLLPTLCDLVVLVSVCGHWR